MRKLEPAADSSIFVIVMALMATLGACSGSGVDGDAQTSAAGVSEMQADEAESIIDACSEFEHRQFDFWLGDFQVSDTTGSVVGTNRITRVANGCGLNEYWRGGNGNNGTSLNWYEPATGEWHQLWVGLGLYLRLSGGLENGSMVLSGARETPRGAVVDRISWTPLEDGRVRQHWEVSSDGGASWQTLFDGLYARR